MQNLANIFVKYSVHERLGVHLVHGHSKVVVSDVMLGHSFTEPSGRWYKPVRIEDVNLTDVHGHIFKLVDGGHFVAYNYVEGKASNLSDVSPDFFKDLVDYLQSHHLEAIVSLQVLDESVENMAEFDFGDCGTVMLNEQDVSNTTPFRITGWVFTHQEGIVSFKGKETHAATTKGPHKVFIDGKLATNVTALKVILKKYKLIN